VKIKPFLLGLMAGRGRVISEARLGQENRRKLIGKQRKGFNLKKKSCCEKIRRGTWIGWKTYNEKNKTTKVERRSIRRTETRKGGKA